MRQDIGRRAFVGTIVAGVPLLAGGPVLLAQSGANGRRQAGARGNKPLDPFLEYSVRELAAIQRRARAAGRMRGEDARAAAQHVRTAAMYAKGIGVDADVIRGIQLAVSANGRDAVMYSQVDQQQVAQDLRQFGFEIEPTADNTGLDYPTRSALLDDLLTGGVTPVLTHAADVLVRGSADADRLAELAARPLLRVDDSSWWAGFCSQLQLEVMRLQWDADAILLASFFMPDLWYAYVVAEAAYAVQYTLYRFLC